MRVLVPGNGSIGWSHEMQCTGKGNERVGCGARLLVEEHDVWHTTYYSWGESEESFTFVCPECGCMTDIDTKYLSGVATSNIRAKFKGSSSYEVVKAESERVKTKRMALRMQGGNA